ncbi:MAG TPA: NAD(P)/FAD-dependent oxidoreductase [Terriglobales bacterium]|jgi:phytoene dehydrogenase-like protein|nr:NAD(P)/FAD-dependent oxidoreductase [Terriglobales bacterium]
MPEKRDVIIIGGGHNGLVTAFYLAQAGFKPMILERRSQLGGAALTEEIIPGFRCSTLAHSAGPLSPRIVRDMQLEKHGLKMLRPETALFAPTADGRALLLHDDAARSAEGIAKFSSKDAANYQEFARALARIAPVLSKILEQSPPDIGNPGAGDLWNLLKTGKALRGLGKADIFRLLRWGPMAVADLAAEWFESEPLRAAIAARGIFGAFLGPWSAGSSLLLLIRAAADVHPAGSAAFVAGGLGALAGAMAASAEQAGVETRTGADVAHITIKDGKAVGVVLADGAEIAAGAVVSNADPKRTLLGMVGASWLQPEFLLKLQNYRCSGVTAKINLALSGLPTFTALRNQISSGSSALGGRIHIGAEIDYLERAFDNAKYGEFSQDPYLDVAIPSVSDPSLAPPGQHVMSVYMQFAPFKLKAGTWPSRRDALADTVVKTLSAYAPDLPPLILHRQVITPEDLEKTYGLTGGHIFHGELALDQFYAMRPLLGWSRYRTPIPGLYLCGSGTHPGSGLNGISGANAAKEILKDLRRR